MDHKKWEAYLSICRKVESRGRNADGNDDPIIHQQQRDFIAKFKEYLPPPARIMVPGGVSEAILLCEEGYEVHAFILGPDNVKWINDRKGRLPHPERLIVRELDAHDLDYPEGYFDGYFSVQFHEHLLSWFAHLGEVRFSSRPGAIAFVDACGLGPSSQMVWHTNLVPEHCVREQWEFWGFKERWRGPHGDSRPQFVFEMLPDGHPEFKYDGYLRWIARVRKGENVNYEFSCRHCGDHK